MSSVYSNPVTVLITRMAYHAAAGEVGRLLAGYFWHDAPLARPDGMNDFPTVQLFLPDIQEKMTGRLGEGTLLCKMAVSTKRSDGIPALLDAVAKVLNAIETDTTGRVNTGLNGTLLGPMELSVGNCFSTDLSLNAEITMTMQPKLFDRAKR